MSTPVPPPRSDAEARAEVESLGSMISKVSSDLSSLMREEVALAKAELKESAKHAGKGAGLFGGAGVAGHFVLLFLSIALWAAIGGTAVGYAWSALIVAVLWAIVAAVFGLLGKKSVDQVEGLPRTQETLKRIPDAATPSQEDHR